MNLEFDEDTSVVINQAAKVFEDIGLVDGRVQSYGVSCWSALVDSGWSELGVEYCRGNVDLGAVAAIYREAGRRLLIEQFVSSGFIASALTAFLSAPDRRYLNSALRDRPVIFLGEGRSSGFDFGRYEQGYCFGIDGSDHLVARIVRDDSTIHLEINEGGLVFIDPIGQLSASVGSVKVRGGTWVPYFLEVDCERLERLQIEAMLVHSAALLGCAEEMLLRARDYSLQRIQFGVVIGSFQALKHSLADVLAAVEVGWSSILCGCADDGSELHRAYAARLLVLEATDLAAKCAAQVFGGIGYTAESDLHLFLKAALDGGHRWGSRDALSAVLGRRVLEDARCSR